MSNNTNTLFWVITGAVIVLGIFTLVLNINSDTVTNITRKMSSLFSNQIVESEKEMLNNSSNLQKYYGYQENWENIKIEDTELFEFDETTGTILDYNGTSSTIIIPYQINGVVVKKIGPLGMNLYNKSNDFNCIEECSEPVKLQNVILPNTIEELADNSFYYSESLKNINLPNSIKKIGKNAFFNSGLTSLDLSNLDQLTYIGENAFNNSNITGDIVFCDSLTYLGQYSFGGNNIINVSLPKNLDVLQARTFFANPNLATLTFRGSETNVSSLYMFHSNAKPTVYVPIGSKDWYKRFQSLSGFNIVEVDI